MSPALLRNRLRLLSDEEKKKWQKLAKLSARQTHRLTATGNRVAHSKETKEAAIKMWIKMYEDLEHQATVEKLAEELEDDEDIGTVPVTTLRRWISESKKCKRKPYAPPSVRESNQPEIFYKMQNSR